MTTTYYVNNATGNDGDGGGEGSPWLTMHHAVGQVDPGDTIQLEATNQPYTEHPTITKSGEPDAPITLRGSDGVIMSHAGIWRLNASYWHIRDLLFENCIRYLQIGRDRVSHGVHFDNCQFQHAQKASVRLFNVRDVAVTHCRFRDIRSRVAGDDTSAIVSKQTARNVLFADCLFEDIGSDGIHFHYGTVGENIVIERCTFRVNRPYGSKPWQDFPPGTGEDGNVGENGIDIKSIQGPVVIRQCDFSGFYVGIPGQDCSGQDKGLAVRIHQGAGEVLIEDCFVQDCPIAVLVNPGSRFDYCGPVTIRRLRTEDVEQRIFTRPGADVIIEDDPLPPPPPPPPLPIETVVEHMQARALWLRISANVLRGQAGELDAKADDIDSDVALLES